MIVGHLLIILIIEFLLYGFTIDFVIFGSLLHVSLDYTVSKDYYCRKLFGVVQLKI